MATIAQSAAKAAQKSLTGFVKQQTFTPAPAAPPASQPLPTGNPWDSDPVLQQIIAQQNQITATAGTNATASRKQLEIAYGYDPNITYEDQATADAAKANPYSILANLVHQHQLNQTNINEGYNKQNLYYSGHRAQALGEELRGYGQSQYNAGQQFTQGLNSIAQNLLAAQQGAGSAVANAQQTAYNNWINQALANQSYAPTTPPPAQPRAMTGLSAAALRVRR